MSLTETGLGQHSSCEGDTDDKLVVRLAVARRGWSRMVPLVREAVAIVLI